LRSGIGGRERGLERGGAKGGRSWRVEGWVGLDGVEEVWGVMRVHRPSGLVMVTCTIHGINININIFNHLVLVSVHVRPSEIRTFCVGLI
jgi:hypothetical protein